MGSVVEAIGFKVKNVKNTLAKLAAIGVKPVAGATARSAAVMSPERVKVWLTEDPSIATASASQELVMKVPVPADGAAWYEKWFGAKVVKQGNDVVAQIPGMNLRFVETKDPVVSTRGRGLDHIGFNVHDLAPLVAKMQEAGVTVVRARQATT